MGNSPRSCLPGGGWRIEDLSQRTFSEVTYLGKPLTVNRVLIKKGEYTQLVYYWFQQRDRIITNEYFVKWYLFLDSMWRHRSDGALVRLTGFLRPGEDISILDEQLAAFLKEVNLHISNYVPN